MAVFDSLDHTTDKAIQNGEDFLKTSEAYYELKLFQVLSVSLSLIVKFTIVASLSLIAIVLLSVAAAIGLGHALNNLVLGYIFVALFFVVLAVFVYTKRRKVERKVIKSLSSIIYK